MHFTYCGPRPPGIVSLETASPAYESSKTEKGPDGGGGSSEGSLWGACGGNLGGGGIRGIPHRKMLDSPPIRNCASRSITCGTNYTKILISELN
jgi:hypothetical protein